jgi:hypothetical protein
MAEIKYKTCGTYFCNEWNNWRCDTLVIPISKPVTGRTGAFGWHVCHRVLLANVSDPRLRIERNKTQLIYSPITDLCPLWLLHDGNADEQLTFLSMDMASFNRYDAYCLRRWYNPTIMSSMTTPSDHQSTSSPYGWPSKTWENVWAIL